MSPLHTLHGCNYSLIWLDSTMPGKEWEARSVQAVFALAIPVCGFPSFQNLLVLSFVFIYLAGDWSRKLWIPDLNRRFWKEELSSQYWSWRAFSVGFTHLAGVSPMTSSCLKGVGLHTYSCFWRHSQCDFFSQNVWWGGVDFVWPQKNKATAPDQKASPVYFLGGE